MKRRTTLGRISQLAIAALALAPQADAQSLSSRIDTLFGPHGIVLDVRPAPGFEHTAHFTSTALSTLGLLVSQLAPGASDFPALSTVPGFSYRYNPELEEFERASNTLGPIFTERARTIGKGRVDVGVAYSYVKFDELNGTDLDSMTLILDHPDSVTFGEEFATVQFERFDLQSHVVSFFATYGITDRWDVNLLLPLVATSLDVRANVKLANVVTGPPCEGPPPGCHFFDVDNFVDEMEYSAKGSETGVGDLLLRTKYLLFTNDQFNFASGLILRVPTGNQENFQGLGDTTLNIFFAAASEISRFHLHATLGFDINLNEADRSRVRYAAGATVQLWDSFAFTADIIGHSNLTSQEISARVPVFGNDAFDLDPESPTIDSYTTVSESLRTDIVDIALGFKVNVFGSLVGFANVLVPLNSDGLRAKAVPTFGFEYSF